MKKVTGTTRIVILLAVACSALLVGKGFASWTYGLNAKAVANANNELSSFQYINSYVPYDGGWYKVVNGQEVLISRQGFYLNNVKPDADGFYATLPATYSGHAGYTVTRLEPPTSDTATILYCPSYFYNPQLGENSKVKILAYDGDVGMPGTTTSIVNSTRHSGWSLFCESSSEAASTGSSHVSPNGAANLTKISFNRDGTNDALEYVGTRAFDYLNNVTSIDSSGCSSFSFMDEFAFCWNVKLTSFTFPSTYNTSTARPAGYFDGTNGHVADGNLYGALHHAYAFTKIDLCATAVDTAKGITTVFPTGVTTIQSNFMRDCIHVTDIVLPSRVTTIKSFDAKNTAFGAREDGAGEFALQHIYYQGTAAALKNLFSAGAYSSNWLANYKQMPNFDGKFHCLTPDTSSGSSVYQYFNLQNSKVVAETTTARYDRLSVYLRELISGCEIPFFAFRKA
jgi:hypothetical protein